MDGYELTALLRADPQYRAIPIVMLTSRAGHKHRAKAEALGVEGYLVKPYQEETLVAAVRQVAGRSTGSSEHHDLGRNLLRVVIAGQPLGIPVDRVHSLAAARDGAIQPSTARPVRLDPGAGRDRRSGRFIGSTAVEPPVGDRRSAVRFAGKMPRALLVDQIEGKIESDAGDPLSPTPPSPSASGDAAHFGDRGRRGACLAGAQRRCSGQWWTRRPWPKRRDSSAATGRTSAFRGELSPATILPLGDVGDTEQALEISVDDELAVALAAVSDPSDQPGGRAGTTTGEPGVRLRRAGVGRQDRTYWVDWRRLLGLDGEPPSDPARWVIAEPGSSRSLIAFPTSSMMSAMDTAESLDLVDSSRRPLSPQ